MISTTTSIIDEPAPILHTHMCPRCGARWSCYDPDCAAPVGLECPNCYGETNE